MFSRFFQKFAPKAPDNKHIKILIIEDSEVDQKLVSTTVIRGGFTSLSAYEGNAGFILAKENKPDLIILDYNLPDIKGPVVCKMLKSEEQTKHIPVLFLTSMDTPGSIINCYEEGGENYLSKPINAKFLLEQINLALKDKKPTE
jgi:DNA-binding response OmpR family regulator